MYGVSFELRIPGIPLDFEPLRSVANALGLGDAQLVPIGRDWITWVELPRAAREILVEPIEYLRDRDDPQFISAAVVRNPFFSPLHPNAGRIGEPLRSMEVLVGRVGDHLAESERVRHFRLQSVKVAEFRSGHVADVFLGHDEKLRYQVAVDPCGETQPIFAVSPHREARAK